MKDFFISYNGADKAWAEWIAWILEEAGYSVVIQAWDFLPGGNFVLEMHKAAAGTEKTIAVLSENYLNAEYTHSEWATAFTQDSQGQKRILIPIRVGECKPTGLLKPLIYADLVNLSEQEAQNAVLGALKDRAKPDSKPQFPGSGEKSEQDSKPLFPGNSEPVPQAPMEKPVTVPKPKRSLSAAERMNLKRKLDGLPPQQLDMLIFTLEPLQKC
ncbi:MAG: toll/interleukin-1 receptor domain-containing protein [Symploca sp. SIO2E9]|nr:toll/interleukin-1 receptor domain-containing protein [Symploca sp. SIO2E9]